jgi:hypothetical protein
MIDPAGGIPGRLQLLEALEVERGALGRLAAVHEPPLRLRRIVLQESLDLDVDPVDVDPAAPVDERIAVDVPQHPAALGLVAHRPRRRRLVGLKNAGLGFVGLLRDAVLDGVPRVRGLEEPSARAREAAALRVAELVPAVRRQPRLRLVLHAQMDALPEPRHRRRRDRLDQAPRREVDPRQARVREDARERPQLDHRLQRPPHVVGLVLRARRDLDVRRRPRPPDRLALRVPPVEQDRPLRVRLRAHQSRRDRRLPPLLGLGDLRPARVEERQPPQPSRVRTECGFTR